MAKDNSSKEACHEAYKKYMKEWKMSEDAAPDLLVWRDAWNAALKWKEK